MLANSYTSFPLLLCYSYLQIQIFTVHLGYSPATILARCEEKRQLFFKPTSLDSHAGTLFFRSAYPTIGSRFFRMVTAISLSITLFEINLQIKDKSKVIVPNLWFTYIYRHLRLNSISCCSLDSRIKIHRSVHFLSKYLAILHVGCR